MNKKEYLQSKLGEAIFLNCVRWGYRGIVEEVSNDGVLLSNPNMIFESSSYTDVKVKEEYSIPSDLFISLDAIETILQPTWCFEGYDKKEKK